MNGTKRFGVGSPIARALAALLALLVAAGLVTPVLAGGGDEVAPEPALLTSTQVAEAVPELPCRSAILMEQETGRVLYEKNADEPMAPASITKVMTLLLTVEALEAGKITLEDKVTTSPHANSMGGTQIWLEIGEQMTVKELLKAIAVVSANDASVAIAEHLAGSEVGFVAEMNRRAAELGMENTRFQNATGLDSEGHLTTARDIAIMSRELMKHPMISEYTTIWMDSLRGGKTQLVNTNRLVRFYKGVTGLKTGTTSDAGSCLSATANRGKLSLVAVSLGSRTSDDRFTSCRSLLDYGFANFDAVEIPDLSESLVPVKVLGGVSPRVELSWQPPAALVVKKGQKDAITGEITLVENLRAPVEQGQNLGTIRLLVGEEVLGEYPVTAAEGVETMNLPRAFAALWGKLIRMLEYQGG